MLLLFLSRGYLIAMSIWLIALLLLFYGLLRYRQSRRKASRGLAAANAGLSIALLLALVTAAELSFACFADFSDTFNITNVSKRWLALHHDDEKNEEGFRDRNPFPRFLPAGKKRIVFLGDSFVAGHGVKRMQDRFTDRIGDWLDRKEPGKYVVANLGEPGYEVAQVTALAEAALFMKRADVSMIIYVYNLNDIEGYDPKMDEPRRQIYAAAPTNPLWRETYFLNWLYFRFVQFHQSGGEQSYFPLLANAYRSAPWLGVEEKLNELQRDCNEAHVDFRMVIFPFLQNLGADYPFREAHAKLVNFCKARKIPVLDLEPIFREHAGESLMVSRFDAHPNERAHAIAAEAIETGLLSDLAKSP